MGANDPVCPDLFSHEAEHGLRRRMPGLSASTVITRAQKIVLSAVVAAAVGIATYQPEIAFLVLVALSSVSFLLGTGFRGFLALRGGETHAPQHAVAIADQALPVYTILVPLYRDILAQTPQAIQRVAA